MNRIPQNQESDVISLSVYAFLVFLRSSDTGIYDRSWIEKAHGIAAC